MLAALVACAATLSAQQRPLPAALELDRQVYRRVLPNGFTYFVQRAGINATPANPRPDRRLVLRLVIKAGSIDEADDQRGLAHMLEHMAFNGSVRFKPGELTSYFESIGAKVGPHVNAATSYDHTTYLLDIPTNRAGAVGRAFEAMRDFAGGITLDPAEIDRERGVVIEEWRGRLGASSRMEGARLTALFGPSRYASRLPIGDPELLQSFPAERLRDFYRDHYRADRMALIVVGNIVDSAVDALVRELFLDLPHSTMTRAAAAIPAHADTRFAALSDPEAPATSVSVVHKRRAEPAAAVADFRAMLERAVVVRMMNARLAEIVRRPDSLFVGAAVADQVLAGGVATITVGAVAAGAPDRALGALAEEIARVRQHGFNQEELDRAQRETLTGYERVRIDPQGLSETLVRHYLYGEPAVGPLMGFTLAKSLLSEMTIAWLGVVARELFADQNRVVTSVSSERPGTVRVTDVMLREAMQAGLGRPVTPWRAAAVVNASAPTPTATGSVRARREIPDIGVTVLTLSNGVNVWLKPTEFPGDVAFSVVSPGGASVASPADFVSASLSGLLVGSAGAGGLSPEQRSGQSAGRTMRVSPLVATSYHGIAGSARPSDLETALELTHLFFTAPNLDPAAFQPARRLFAAAMANQAQNPAYALLERVTRVNGSDHYTVRAPRPEDLTQMDDAVIARFYRERFANAADFTFFIVGGFDIQTITPMVTRHLATLPSTGVAAARAADIRPQFPSSIVRETVTRGREPSGQTALTFFADTGLDDVEIFRARAAAAVLQTRLLAVLREELSATYSVAVTYADLAPQRGYGTISVRFGSAPGAAERLTTRVLGEVDRLRMDGPSAPELQAVKATMSRTLPAALRQNAYWVANLQMSQLLGGDPARIPMVIGIVDALSAESVRDAARKYMPLDRYTVVTLIPELK